MDKMVNKKQEYYGISTPLLKKVPDIHAICSPTLRGIYDGTLNIDLANEILTALKPCEILRGLYYCDDIGPRVHLHF